MKAPYLSEKPESYAGDIEKLHKAWPNPIDMRGKLISHEEIAEVLGYTRDGPRASRYKGVVGRFRKNWEKTGVYTDGARIEARGQGIWVRTAQQMLENGKRRGEQAIRRYTKGLEELLAINSSDLTQLGQAELVKELRHFTMVKEQIYITKAKVVPRISERKEDKAE